MSDTKREYIVTLKNFEDLEAFYQDMETPGGNLYIPNRAVDLASRRPISRSTHYYLTDEEANILSQDSRVDYVTKTPEDLGIQFRPVYVQSSLKWDRSNINFRNDHRNWGLYRCTLSSNVSNWGSDITPTQVGTVDIPTTGKNVDVVICDGHIDPDHPEFAVNADGTGGSRVIQYNWFQHNLEVIGQPNGTYVYTPYVDPSYADTNGDGISDRTSDNDHGCHVAGTACGNTQGWARDASIYNLSPYSTNVNYISSPTIIDYIRAFHRNKSINPLTGKKNPTIVNMSWGASLLRPLSEIQKINYRGTEYTGPFTAAQASGYGITVVRVSSGAYYYYSPVRYYPIDIDIEDAIREGIIFVGAAGNSYSKISTITDSDYNNLLSVSYYGTFEYMQGGTPSSAGNVICVGAVDSVFNESKANFSCAGPRVDIFAPGVNIMSSVNSSTDGGTYDYRNAGKYVTKKSGTSMASPQVAGLIACALEIYPTMNQEQARNYVIGNSKLNQMTNTGGGYTDYTSLQGAQNRYLFYKRESTDTGQIFPKQNTGVRAATGQIYPRPRIYSFGRQTPAQG